MSDQASPLPAAEPRITAPVYRDLGQRHRSRRPLLARCARLEVHQPPDDGTAVLHPDERGFASARVMVRVRPLSSSTSTTSKGCAP